MEKREIKFRAWDKSREVMMQPFISYYTKDGIITVSEDYHEDDGPNDWDKSFCANELMQFTGLKDKNKNDLYEGDIVQFEFVTEISKRMVNGLIVYRNDHCCFQAKYDGGVKFQNAYRLLVADPYDNKNPSKVFFDPEIEIIGNIYENPHLLTPTV